MAQVGEGAVMTLRVRHKWPRSHLFEERPKCLYALVLKMPGLEGSQHVARFPEQSCTRVLNARDLLAGQGMTSEKEPLAKENFTGAFQHSPLRAPGVGDQRPRRRGRFDVGQLFNDDSDGRGKNHQVCATDRLREFRLAFVNCAAFDSLRQNLTPVAADDSPAEPRGFQRQPPRTADEAGTDDRGVTK